MVFIIIPAAIGLLGLGVTALAAREERRQKEEKQKEEARRQAQRAAKSKEDHRWRVDVADRFIARHGLRITSKRLIELASNGAADLMVVIESQSKFTRELQETCDVVRNLESKTKEVTDLITVIECSKPS